MTTATVNAQALIDAVRDAVTTAGVPFGDARMPARDGSKPWIVAWADSGLYSSRTLAGGDGWSMAITCHCYGLTADAARIAARLLAVALRSLRGAAVGGRTVGVVEHLTSLPVSRDDAVNPPTFDAVAEWRLQLT